MDYSTPDFPVHHQLPDLLKFMSIEQVMPSNHVILCRPLLLLPSIFPTQQQGLFKWVSSLHLMAKVLEFQLQHQDCSPLGWTSWISLQSKVVSSLLQHHSSKGSIPRCSDFFIVQLSHPYMKWSEGESLSVVSDSLRPRGLYNPWNCPGQNTGVDSLSLLQGIFPTQGSNPGLPHCRRIPYQLSHQGGPCVYMKSRLFSRIGYYKILSRVPCAI